MFQRTPPSPPSFLFQNKHTDLDPIKLKCSKIIQYKRKHYKELNLKNIAIYLHKNLRKVTLQRKIN